MKSKKSFHLKRKQVVLTVFGMLALGLGAVGMNPLQAQRSGIPNLKGYPYDWSHHHVVFGTPQTAADAVQMQKDPRYWHQWLRRNTRPTQPDATELAPGGTAALSSWPPISTDEARRRRMPRSGSSQGLLGMSLGTNNANAGAGNFPAKYKFADTTTTDFASGSCSDYVASNTSTAGTGYTVNMTFSAASDTGGSIAIKNGANTLTLTAGSANSARTWNNSSTTAATNAANFVAIVNANASFTSGVNVYATANGATVTIHTGSTSGVTVANSSLSNITTPSSGNSVTVASGSSAATLIAYEDLYSSCTGNPTVAWQYYTGGTIQTSLALSEDGTQVAFMQSFNNGTSSTAQLVLLTVGSSNTLSFPTIVQPSSYNNCTAPCMTVFDLGVDDTTSSPFVDYSHDSLYVGDASGILHYFTTVFTGTPTAGATLTVGSTTAALSSPVVDLNAGDQQVFVTTFGTGTNSGELVRCPLGIASVTERSMAYTTITDDPLVASGTTSGASRIFVFRDYSTDNYVNDYPDNFGSSSNGTDLDVATSGSATFYVGDFDNAYYSSSSPSSASTGHLYVCAGTAPVLYRISLTSGGDVSSATTGPTIGTTASCSPVTEYYNVGTSTDYIYFSVTTGGTWGGATGAAAKCEGACLYGLNLGTTFGTSMTPTSGFNTPAGTSGIVIDNYASGGSQIYTTFLSGSDTVTTKTASISGTTLTSTSLSASLIGNTVTGTGVSAGTVVTAVSSTTSATVSISQTVSSKTLSFTNSCPSPASSGSLGCLLQASQANLQ